MLNLKQKISAGVATAAMASSVLAGAAFADSSVHVGGNGAFSENDVQLDVNSNVDVQQTSNTEVRNAIINAANTGGVVASFNTGGDVDVRTGDATAVTMVDVQGGENVLDMNNCSTCGNTDVSVYGNGAFSENDVDVDNNTNIDVRQTTRTNVVNEIVNAANTGGVVGSFNTGGDVNVRTGDATAVTDVRVEGGNNYADLGDCACGGGIDVKVKGNGAFSVNDVDVDVDKDINVDQESNTDVRNEIVNAANTGLVAAFGTGGLDYDHGKMKHYGDFDYDFDKKYKDRDYKKKAKKYHGKDYDFKYMKYGDFNRKYHDRDMYMKYGKNHDKKNHYMGDNHLMYWFFDRYFNTGGDTEIRTGDADARVYVDVSGSDNVFL